MPDTAVEVPGENHSLPTTGYIKNPDLYGTFHRVKVMQPIYTDDRCSSIGTDSYLLQGSSRYGEIALLIGISSDIQAN